MATPPLVWKITELGCKIVHFTEKAERAHAEGRTRLAEYFTSRRDHFIAELEALQSTHNDAEGDA